MNRSGKLLRAAAHSNEAFSRSLKQTLSELDMTLKEFAETSGISASTLYKVVSAERSPSLEILRKALKTLEEIDGGRSGDFIAVIAARHVLDEVVERSIRIDGDELLTREYPATTLEDAIVASVRAERDGARAIVCAPIVSTTIERVVDIPIATIMPRNSVTEAIRLAARKSSLRDVVISTRPRD
ncbi:MAG: helix-turn-helix domain-containing protein [Methanobacteriota archaeon]|nr:MAG: helix-turn-helix domain-containing protein [Euryarchaeota archaeon]